MDGLEIERRIGADIASAIEDLARLRIEVFRDFPYLYDGSMSYEKRYLQTYCASPGALAVLVRDRATGRVVGASTGMPLEEETEEFRRPLSEHGFDPAALFYCGESVLEKAYRGRGVYRRFFAEREEYGRRLGKTHSCFCAVVRPADHPLRPEGYQPLDQVWNHFGYRLLDGVVASYSWQDVGDSEEREHRMQFWLKEL